jgi:hypothetical protein
VLEAFRKAREAFAAIPRDELMVDEAEDVAEETLSLGDISDASHEEHE